VIAGLAFGLFAAVMPPSVAGAGAPSFDAAAAERFANLALACIDREYPNKIAHALASDADVKPPRQLTPAFFGCYDWHSAVHGHWLLVRLLRLFPEAPFAARARAMLDRHLTPANLAAETSYITAPGRETFERPYGLAWLLLLDAELHEWQDPQGKRWDAAMAPLAAAAATRLTTWLPKLTHPVRIGEHNQTAFSLGLALDWARGRGDEAAAALFARRALDLFAADQACPLAYEPSGEDFLSPCLAEADLMRRILPSEDFAAWLGRFLPNLPSGATASGDWLPLGVVTDRSDGKLAHLDGLNLSRAWRLEGIAAGLPPGDARLPGLRAAAAAHGAAGLSAVTGEHYEGGHWLGSFAVYLSSGRGLSTGGASPSAATRGTADSAPAAPVHPSPPWRQ
jgi:Protein of unknown function (DUF2891)